MGDVYVILSISNLRWFKVILGIKLFLVVYILKYVLGSLILWKCYFFLYIVDICKYCC